MIEKTCPKCSYTRSPSEECPDWQCPSCGIAYDKFKASDNESVSLSESNEPFENQARPRELGRRNAGLLIVAVAMVFAILTLIFKSKGQPITEVSQVPEITEVVNAKAQVTPEAKTLETPQKIIVGTNTTKEIRIPGFDFSAPDIVDTVKHECHLALLRAEEEPNRGIEDTYNIHMKGKECKPRYKLGADPNVDYPVMWYPYFNYGGIDAPAEFSFSGQGSIATVEILIPWKKIGQVPMLAKAMIQKFGNKFELKHSFKEKIDGQEIDGTLSAWRDSAGNELLLAVPDARYADSILVRPRVFLHSAEVVKAYDLLLSSDATVIKTESMRSIVSRGKALQSRLDEIKKNL